MAESAPVLFRVHRGELCAYLPAEKWPDGRISTYCHIGQHGSADPSWLRRGRRARPEEYRDLLAEMRQIYEAEPDPIKLVVRLRNSGGRTNG
jgi:hypothetical protein